MTRHFTKPKSDAHADLTSVQSDLVSVYQGIRSRLDLKGRALVITLLCDVVRPRANALFMSELLDMMAALEINDRLLRTAMFRMSRDGWLSADRIGRQALYRVTDLGWRLIDPGCRQFYTSPDADWDGQWTLIVLDNHRVTAEQRRQAARTLRWRGFGVVAGNVFAHPGIKLSLTRDILREAGLTGMAIAMRAEAQDVAESASLGDMVAATWDIEQLQSDYRDRLALFAPLTDFNFDKDCAPAMAFALRIMLMHAFKEVVLRDPGLPAKLLPENWAGQAARALIRDLYWRLVPASEVFIAEILQKNPARQDLGDVPVEPAAWFYRRLGGPSTTK